MAAEIGVPREAFDGATGLPDLTKMIPIFEEKVLEHRDGHYIVQDWMGAITEISDQFDYTYIRSAKDFVTRHWHSFPVKNRADWEEKIKWRYDPADPLRFTPEFWAKAEAAAGVGQGGHDLDQRPLLADARVGGHGAAVRDDGRRSAARRTTWPQTGPSSPWQCSKRCCAACASTSSAPPRTWPTRPTA